MYIFHVHSHIVHSPQLGSSGVQYIEGSTMYNTWIAYSWRALVYIFHVHSHIVHSPQLACSGVHYIEGSTWIAYSWLALGCTFFMYIDPSWLALVYTTLGELWCTAEGGSMCITATPPIYSPLPLLTAVPRPLNLAFSRLTPCGPIGYLVQRKCLFSKF